MFALVGITSYIKTEAAHIASRLVGKTGGHRLAGTPAMRYKSVEQQRAAHHINDKQSFLIGRKAEIDVKVRP